MPDIPPDLQFVLIVFLTIALWYFLNKSAYRGIDNKIKARKKEEMDALDRVDLEYCKNLHNFFNTHAFCSPGLTQKQLIVLYATAQHIEYKRRLRMPQLLAIWGCDGTDIQRLHLTADLEVLVNKELVDISYEYTGRTYFLTQKGRDYLIKNKII